MNFLSLFSGIGGLDLGLERSGMTCIGQVEINPFCRRVLAKRWPNVRRFEDVRTVTAKDFENERIDLIAGGFPCQDISSSGKKVGITGHKSGLWLEFLRLIRDIRPRFVLVENVAALLGRGLGDVLGGLAASGFDAEWETLPAGLFGAPHLRSRTFVVGYSDRYRKSDGSLNDEASWLPPLVANAEHAFREQLGEMGRAWGKRESVPWNANGECTDPTMAVRMDDGDANRMDRLSGIGNAVVPQVAEWIGRRIMEAEEPPCR